MCHALEFAFAGAAFRESSVRENRAIHRLTYAGDLTGLRWRQCWALLPFLKYIVQGVERYYPETAGRVILFNAPVWIPPLLAAVKLFIHKNTAANLHILSGSKELRDIVGPSVLPREWG